MFSMDTTIPNPSGATPAESEITYQAPPAFNISASPLNMSFYITDGEWTVTSTFSVLTYILECDTAPEFTNMPNFTTIDENVTGINYFFTASIYDPDLPSDTNEDFQFLLSNGTLTSAYDEWIISSAGRKNYSSELFATFVNLPLFLEIGYSFPGFDYYVNPSYVLYVVYSNTPFNGPNFTDVSITSRLVIAINLINQSPILLLPNGSFNNTVSIYENETFSQVLYSLSAVDREGDAMFFNISSMFPNNTALRIPWGTKCWLIKFVLLKTIFSFSFH